MQCDDCLRKVRAVYSLMDDSDGEFWLCVSCWWKIKRRLPTRELRVT